MSSKDKILLRKRSLIETVNDQLKNISQIEHARPRGCANFLIHLIGGIAAYCLQPKKLFSKSGKSDLSQLMAA